MDFIQVLTLALLGVFYVAYFLKAITLKRHGINVNLLGRGNKPRKALIIEIFLRFATLGGAVVQFGSVMFPDYVWSVSAILPVSIIGVVFLILGNVIFIAAMLTMRNNWRAGFDNNQNTELVTNGVYQFSRNPAFVGFDLLYIGCAAIFPNIINMAAALVCVILFHIQILQEEKFCAVAFGKEYQDYKSKTLRYLGKRGRLSEKLKARAKQLKTDIPAVFLAMKRRETPFLAKILAGIAIVYALSPIDLIPDFIPVIGLLDDLIIVPALIVIIVKLIPADVFADCRKEAVGLWAGGKPKKWYYALPIVLIWLLLIFIIVKAIWL